jgi:hypothetical protein
MNRDSDTPQPQELEWETPAAEEIAVSAECSAYMGVWTDEN